MKAPEPLGRRARRTPVPVWTLDEGCGSEGAFENPKPKSLTNADTPLLSLPLSYIRSGWYNDVSIRTGNTSFWTPRSSDNRHARNYDSKDHAVGIQDWAIKKSGFSLRCVRPKDFVKAPHWRRLARFLLGNIRSLRARTRRPSPVTTG